MSAGMLKIGSNYICLAMVLIDFVLKRDKNYHSQVFLEEFKYIKKEKKVTRHITDVLEFSSE